MFRESKDRFNSQSSKKRSVSNRPFRREILVEKPLPETRDKVLLLEGRDISLVREAIYIEHLGEIGFK